MRGCAEYHVRGMRGSDVEADLEILALCFAAKMRARMEKRDDTAVDGKMMAALGRLREVMDDDEEVAFSLEIQKRACKEGEVPPFANVKAYITKRNEE